MIYALENAHAHRLLIRSPGFRLPGDDRREGRPIMLSTSFRHPPSRNDRSPVRWGGPNCRTGSEPGLPAEPRRHSRHRSARLSGWTLPACSAAPPGGWGSIVREFHLPLSTPTRE